MKKIVPLILFLCLGYSAFCQQSSKLDNEQLLDMIQGQRYSEAAAYIRSVYPDIITDAKVRSRLAYCNYMSGNLPEAEKSYLSILFADTTNRTAMNYLAAINEKRRNYSVAKTFYERMLRLDSMNANVYKQLAEMADNLMDTAGVLKNLVKANSINPRDPDVAYDLSNILIKKKRYTFADTVLKKAMEADPQNILLINGRMELAYKLKNFKQTIDYAKQAIALGDIAAQTYSLMAIGNYFLKNYAECIKIYKMMEGTPNANETTYYYTALSYRELDSLQKSNDYLTSSIAAGISDNVPVYYHEMSLNSEMLKKFRASINFLNKAEEFQPNNIFNYSRGRIYDYYLKDPKTALKYYKKFVKDYNKDKDDKDSYAYSVQRVKDLSPKPAVKN